MLRIYHAPGTRSVRPIWLCFELELEVEIKTIDFSPTYRNTPEWRAISPAGKVPILVDDDLTMFESGAMLDYILERYGDGQLQPQPGTAAAALHHQWCWFSEATLLRPLGLNRLLRDPDGLAEDAATKTREAMRVVEAALEDHAYLLGQEFAAADIMMGYAMHLLDRLKLLDVEFPASADYLERLRARPACARALDA